MPRDLQQFISDPSRPAFFESVPFEFGADARPSDRTLAGVPGEER